MAFLRAASLRRAAVCARLPSTVVCTPALRAAVLCARAASSQPDMTRSAVEEWFSAPPASAERAAAAAVVKLQAGEHLLYIGGKGTKKRYAHTAAARFRLARCRRARCTSMLSYPSFGVLLCCARGCVECSVLLQFAFSSTLGVYALVARGVSVFMPELSYETTWLTAISAGVSVLGLLTAVASSRANIRYAVLTADGHHLRVYPYGPFFGMVRAPQQRQRAALTREAGLV
ncbi:hypothetical protein EON67_08015 [archaeon]|nr:MAG: hypothetical protein EON67_08015 [archaeon]